MKFRWEKKYLYWGLTAFLVIVLSISFFILLYNFRSVYNVAARIISILMPFIIGLSIAYLLCPIMTFFESRILTWIWKKFKWKQNKTVLRVVSLIITILVAFALLTSLLFMIIPQLAVSIEAIFVNFSTYLSNFEKWITGLLSSNPDLQELLTNEFDDIGSTIVDWGKNNLLPQMNSVLSGVTSGVIDVFIFVKNVFIGLIISVYVLFSKEKFFAQTKKLIYSIIPVKGANRIISVTRRAHKVFGGFITGKLIDSLIMGILCFIVFSILQMPYALLISVIVGVTNVIPFFGPFFGAIPSALLILMIDPLKCLYFVIAILALQQFDGNILGPKILGDSTGLSAFWVIFAILISGGLFGFVGMLIGVPAFAVIYSLIVELVENRLRKHELPVTTKEYYNLSSVDEIDYDPLYDNIDDEDVKIFAAEKADKNDKAEKTNRKTRK